MSRFQFVADHQHAYGVKRLCGLLTVSRSGFYQWRRTAPARAEREHADQVLTAQIVVIHRASDDTYGSPRVTAELCDTGRMINHKRVERLMRQGGTRGTCKKAPKPRTRPDPGSGPIQRIHRAQTSQSTSATSPPPNGRPVPLPDNGVGPELQTSGGLVDRRPHAHRAGR